MALAGQQITLRGDTPSPVDDASMLEQAPNRCAAGAYLCATSDSTASDDLTQPIVLVDSGPDPVFPGETQRAVLVLDRVVVYGGVSGSGSAVRVLDGNVLLLRDAVLSSNLAYTAGGAVYAGPDSLVLVDHSLITENVSVSRGAGIYIDGGAIAVSDSLFYANQGTRSGGLEVVDGSLALTDSEFSLNSAPQIEVSLSVGIATLNGVAVRGPDAVLSGGMWAMPTGVPQLRIGEGAGLVSMVDLRVVGGDPYLEAEGPFEVSGSVFAGSGASGAVPVVRVTETLGSFHRSIFSSVSNGPVAYERATGELMNTIFLDGGSGAGPFVTSEGTVFGPAIASNGFPDVAMRPYSGAPFYPGALNSPAVSCQAIGSCIASDLAVFGDPMFFRFHPALARDLWDLHLLPGSPMLMPGPNDIGIYASNTTYHIDQDGDGWPDLWEAAVGLVGIAADGPNDDPDNDGLPNSEELAQGGIALGDDTDGDGTLDGSESSGCLLDPRCQ